MEGDRITQLNEGLKQFKQDLQADSLARKRSEVAIITFGNRIDGEDVALVQDFARVHEEFSVPTLKAGGSTPMGKALIMALNELDQRKDLYRNQGIQYTRPWLFLITDGEPTDDEIFERAVKLAQSRQDERAVTIFCIGVDGASVSEMKRVSPEYTMMLKPDFTFSAFFKFLSTSMANATRSAPGQKVAMGDTTGLQIAL